MTKRDEQQCNVMKSSAGRRRADATLRPAAFAAKRCRRHSLIFQHGQTCIASAAAFYGFVHQAVRHARLA